MKFNSVKVVYGCLKCNRFLQQTYHAIGNFDALYKRLKDMEYYWCGYCKDNSMRITKITCELNRDNGFIVTLDFVCVLCDITTRERVFFHSVKDMNENINYVAHRFVCPSCGLYSMKRETKKEL